MTADRPTIEAVIPVYRPGPGFTQLLDRLARQVHPVSKIHIMHTEDGMEPDLSGVPIPVEVHDLRREDFDHGGTRDRGMRSCTADYVLMMTQDALPANSRLTQELARALSDERCGVAYARQMSRPQDGAIERFTRQFNYPAQERVQSADSLDELGVKTYFCSDVCAMYRRELYEELGGFEQPCIFNEDMIYAYRLIQAGHVIRYTPEACVIHSHHYSGLRQLRRNFDLGVSQAQHPEIFAGLSSASEGKRLVRRTAGHLLKKGRILSVFYLVYYSGMKWLGYRLGRSYRRLPRPVVRRISLNQNYWKH